MKQMTRKELIEKLEKLQIGEWIGVWDTVGVVRKAEGFNVQDNGVGEIFDTTQEAADVALEWSNE